MPENQAVPGAAPFLFFDDDGGFGDFKFVSSSPSPPPQRWGEDDEWGDFIATPLGSFPFNPPTTSSNPPTLFDPFPDPTPIPPASGGKSWERPSGALPLSIFGDEEVEEPDPTSHPDPIFSSPSLRTGKDETGSGQGRDLKDLLANLYGPPPAPAGNGAAPCLGQGDDDLDWEFKGSVSIDDGVKEEEVILGTSRLENKAAANGNGIRVDNRSQESQETIGQLRVGNVEHLLSDVCVAHDGFANGLDFGSIVNHSHHISETNQQSRYINNGNVLQTSLVNGYKSDDENCMKFKDAFLEVEDVTGSLGNQKFPDAGAEVVLMPIVEIRGTTNIWESNLSDLHKSSYNNGKKDYGGPYEDHSWPSCEPKVVGINSYMGVSHNDIISNLYDKSDKVYNVFPAQNPTENEPKSAELGPHSVIVNDDRGLDEMHWEFQEASETAVRDQHSALKLDHSFPTESSQNTYLDLYCKLQEECLVLIAHHLDDLKKAREVAAISGEQAKVIEIEEEIQAAYKKLPEGTVSENCFRGKHPSNTHVRQLLVVIKESHFQALEQEYCLQERILSAEKDLSATIELFEHTISVLQILGIASEEEQRTYITAWSKMAMACAHELRHGAMIWEESIRANVCTEILSRGNQYFVALAEIYRVSEIVRASLELYKPWLLSSRGDSSELLTSLEKCAEAWRTLGLEKALESISSTMDVQHDGRARPLLESIKLIRDLDGLSLRNHASSHEKTICKLSLLPVGVLQGMKDVVWDGEHYCLQLANMWANRVSRHPPQLPHIHA